jgi:hypothetical protein
VLILASMMHHRRHDSSSEKHLWDKDLPISFDAAHFLFHTRHFGRARLAKAHVAVIPTSFTEAEHAWHTDIG